MRIIKSNNLKYPSFHSSLPMVEKEDYIVNETADFNYVNNIRRNKEYSQNKNIFHQIKNFQNQVNRTYDLFELSQLFRKTISNLLTFRNATIYLYDSEDNLFRPLADNDNKDITDVINKVHKSGSLNWIFEEGQSTIIPNAVDNDIDISKLNYIIIPILDGKKKKGVLSLISPLHVISDFSTDSYIIKICLDSLLNRVKLLNDRSALTSAYKEVQVYQSKISNDYKLSAIGELTSGIVEDILSPLQIILSYSDMLSKTELSELEADYIETIKFQVNRVKTVINRLIKFSSINENEIKIQSCNINEIIEEFYNVINSSLQKDNYECLIDLEKNIPPLLSHPNYLTQLLTNVFSIIKPSDSKGGGILIQTKYVKDSLSIKVVTSDYIECLNDETFNNTQDLNLKIIYNLMKKHEGQVVLDSYGSSGSSILLIFPLKRKVRR